MMSYFELEFYIDGSPVGLFKEAFPVSDGCYCYEPYRGAGHFDLWRTIEAFDFARCFYEIGSDVMYFSARDAGEYGFLNLSNFEKVPKHLNGYEL